MEPKSQPLEFEEVPQCMLCGSTEQHDAKGVSWQGVAFSYCLCARCGLKYMRPRPTSEGYQVFYRDQYWQQNLAASGFASVTEYNDPNADQLALRRPKYEAAYRQVRDDLRGTGRLDRNLSILEVGCAFGYTLEWLHRDFGCRVAGVEPSTVAVERCVEGGVEIVGGTAEDFFVDRHPGAAEERYDVILFRHCLATLAAPLPVLEGVRRFLKPDGLLLIYTVNVEYYDAMDPYHPYLYTPDTLRRLLARSGFEVVRLDASPSPVDHATATRVLHPSYQMGCFARPAEPREPPFPTIDPIRLLKTMERGQMVMAWRYLSLGDLLRRAGRKILHRFRRVRH